MRWRSFSPWCLVGAWLVCFVSGVPKSPIIGTIRAKKAILLDNSCNGGRVPFHLSLPALPESALLPLRVCVYYTNPNDACADRVPSRGGQTKADTIYRIFDGYNITRQLPIQQSASLPKGICLHA